VPRAARAPISLLLLAQRSGLTRCERRLLVVYAAGTPSSRTIRAYGVRQQPADLIEPCVHGECRPPGHAFGRKLSLP
jgi:hypothetical protein